MDVNVMPASVDSLLFKDPKLKKLDPCMKIRTYIKDTFKIVSSYKFYLVHLDTKKLQEVTFFVAKNDGSVLNKLWGYYPCLYTSWINSGTDKTK